MVRYSEKKTKQYFSEKKVNKDAQRKQQAQHSHITSAISKPAAKEENELNLDDIEQFRFTRSQARELRVVEPASSQDRKKNRFLAPTRSKKEAGSDYKYISQNENTRSKQDKLNELLAIQSGGVRRSGRNLHKQRQVMDDDVFSPSRLVLELLSCATVRWRRPTKAATNGWRGRGRRGWSGCSSLHNLPSPTQSRGCWTQGINTIMCISPNS